MSVISLATLQEKAQQTPFACCIHVQLQSVLEKMSRNGKPFLETKLADASGMLTIRIWNDSPLFETIRGLGSGAFVSLQGFWVRNPPFGLEPQELDSRPLDEREALATLHGCNDLRERQTQDYLTITELIASMRDPRLKHVCDLFLKHYGERFRRSAAARTYHHARRGGLVEHCAQMMRSAAALCTAYCQLNRDLLLAGVLFHDCGKLWENCYQEKDFTMHYSEAGELLGHIPLGIETVNKLWRILLESDEFLAWRDLQPSEHQVRLHLLHLVAAHHGEHAFGSPVLPKTPEAMALHYIDNLDAKMEMFAETYRKGTLLSRTVVERLRPLPANLVHPLAPFQPHSEDVS